MFSEPVVGERFFGREEVLELLNKRVLALKDGYRQNVALTGQSLAGKSSIILHFLHTVREEGFIPIYVEVVKEPFKVFANKFIATMLYNALRKAGDDAGVEMERLIERGAKAFPKTSAAIKQVNSLIDRGEFDEAYLSLLGITSVLKEETGLACIVILDEFDNLEHLGIKNPFLGFGKVIMVQKGTMYIVSSSRNEAIKKIISEKLSLLFGNFEVVRVSNFSFKASSSFLDVKLAGFDIAAELKKFLMAFTDGNPFYLDNLTGAVKHLAISRLAAYIDEKAISDAILELVYNANGAIHQYLFNFLLSVLDTKYREAHILILAAIANGQNKQPDIARALRAKRAEVASGISRLQELGLVSKNGAFYRIDDTMLGFWLKHVYQRRKALLVDGTFERRSVFDEDVRAYISNFIRESAKETISRLAELFNLFSNELVSIDSKQMRLPHFTRVETRFFGDSRPFIASSFRSNFWVTVPYETCVAENDVINLVKNLKELGHKISNKVIFPLAGIDENAKLLAKELRISIWDLSTVNMLLNFYGKERLVIL